MNTFYSIFTFLAPVAQHLIFLRSFYDHCIKRDLCVYFLSLHTQFHRTEFFQFPSSNKFYQLIKFPHDETKILFFIRQRSLLRRRLPFIKSALEITIRLADWRVTPLVVRNQRYVHICVRTLSFIMDGRLAPDTSAAINLDYPN